MTPRPPRCCGELDSECPAGYVDFKMSERVRGALLRLEQEMKENEAEVRRLFDRAGIQPDPALLVSVLIYHKTLEKLAKE